MDQRTELQAGIAERRRFGHALVCSALLGALACSSTQDSEPSGDGSAQDPNGGGGTPGEMDDPSVDPSSGGSGGSPDNPGTGGTVPEGPTRPVITGPRPPNNALGFYDIDPSGNERAIENSLSGDLAAMVQFVQSHSVWASGNDALNLPSVVSERAALLLITPQDQTLEGLELAWSVGGQERGRTPLRHPNDLPRSDSTNADGRPQLVYSKRAWWYVLPWEDMVPGLELTIVGASGQEGTLAASEIDFASPAHLTLKIMSLGMLTDPLDDAEDHWMLKEPIRSASDYFETIPIAELNLGIYDSVRLDRVMVSDGTIYTTASSTEGGTYDGDMRQDVAKASYSGGVNNADQGINSSPMRQESNPRTTPAVIIHHAQGNYTNGVQRHGLSGGAGIGTLWSSHGNELTRELGHNWGLGHYPGAEGENYFWAAHHYESGWGFVQRRMRMRGNLDWTGDGAATTTSGVSSDVTWDNGVYAFNNDPMSGADLRSSLSRVTHHTGYSARLSQQFFDRGIVSETSSTGYVAWNREQQKLEEFDPPAGVRKPDQIGVPIYTFWGGYDPQTMTGVLYPALRGNYGHVFSLDEPPSTGDACWVDIAVVGGETIQVALHGQRHDGASVNKLHFNLAQDQEPTAATLLCRDGGDVTQIDSINISAPSAAQPEAVRVGRDAGFSTVHSLELATLSDVLAGLGPDEILPFSSDQWDLLDQLYDSFPLLQQPARDHAYRLAALLDAVRALDSWMMENEAELDSNDADTLSELRAEIERLGLANGADQSLPPTIRIEHGSECLAIGGDGDASLESCDNSASQSFIMDARGAFHPATDLSLCLSGGSNNSEVGFTKCDRFNGSQSWSLEADGTIALTSSASGVLDSGGGVVLYAHHGGGSQQWAGAVRSSSLLLAMLSAYNLQRLAALLD